MAASSSLVTCDNKNAAKVMCTFCDSVVLSPDTGTLSTFDKDLPKITQKKGTSTEFSKCSQFWEVKDHFDFDNVGFTHSVDGVKFLTCADCEMGPIGFQDKDTKLNYVAFERVKQ